MTKEYLVRAQEKEPEYLEVAKDLRGYSWTPYQSAAHRFTDKEEANRLAEEHGATVVRLKPRPTIEKRVESLEHALRVLRADFTLLKLKSGDFNGLP